MVCCARVIVNCTVWRQKPCKFRRLLHPPPVGASCTGCCVVTVGWVVDNSTWLQHASAGHLTFVTWVAPQAEQCVRSDASEADSCIGNVGRGAHAAGIDGAQHRVIGLHSQRLAASTLLLCLIGTALLSVLRAGDQTLCRRGESQKGHRVPYPDV
jgi:hypothetical protein